MGQRALSKHEAEATTERTTLADGSTCYRSHKFTQVITRLAPGHVLVTAYGYNSGESAPLITAHMAYEIPQGGTLSAYVNLTHETGQASAAREWWADWNKQYKNELNPAHILVRSRIMEMAISVLSMIVGGGKINAHSSEATFIAVIAQAVPGFRQLPKFPDLPPLLK
ncbi:MAG: hypothetical protein ABUL62_15555 [Myxococcales bacterium]